jgi:hypothetical protein
VQRWVQRAKRQRLDRVDWTDRPCGLSTPVNRTQRPREDLVLTIRQQLRDTSDLGVLALTPLCDRGVCMSSIRYQKCPQQEGRVCPQLNRP